MPVLAHERDFRVDRRKHLLYRASYISSFFPPVFFYCFLPLFNKNPDVVIKMLTLISPVFFSFSFNFFFFFLSCVTAFDKRWSFLMNSLLVINAVLGLSYAL